MYRWRYCGRLFGYPRNKIFWLRVRKERRVRAVIKINLLNCALSSEQIIRAMSLPMTFMENDPLWRRLDSKNFTAINQRGYSFSDDKWCLRNIIIKNYEALKNCFIYLCILIAFELISHWKIRKFLNIALLRLYFFILTTKIFILISSNIYFLMVMLNIFLNIVLHWSKNPIKVATVIRHFMYVYRSFMIRVIRIIMEDSFILTLSNSVRIFRYSFTRRFIN